MWEQQCPKALEAKELAHQAYLQCPRQFIVVGRSTQQHSNGPTPAAATLSHTLSQDSFQLVELRKRKTPQMLQASSMPLGQASSTLARHGQPPLRVINKVIVQSQDITQMLSQESISLTAPNTQDSFSLTFPTTQELLAPSS